MSNLCYFQHQNMRQMKQFVQDLYSSVEGGLFTAAGTVPCKDMRDLGGQHQEFCLGQRILEVDIV